MTVSVRRRGKRVSTIPTTSQALIYVVPLSLVAPLKELSWLGQFTSGLQKISFINRAWSFEIGYLHGRYPNLSMNSFRIITIQQRVDLLRTTGHPTKVGYHWHWWGLCAPQWMIHWALILWRLSALAPCRHHRLSFSRRLSTKKCSHFLSCLLLTCSPLGYFFNRLFLTSVLEVGYLSSSCLGVMTIF